MASKKTDSATPSVKELTVAVLASTWSVVVATGATLASGAGAEAPGTATPSGHAFGPAMAP